MLRRALLALTIVLSGACRSEIQLGGPDAGATSTAPTGTVVVVPPRCSGLPSRDVVTTIEASWGDVRAIAASSGVLYALFARVATNEGVLARVRSAGGMLAEVARVGLDPSALAVSPDGSFVFAASRGSAQVFRVDSLGTAIVSDARGAPSSIVTDDHAGAFWTLPSNDSIIAWDFTTSAPGAIATSPGATSLLRSGGTLFITGDATLRAFAPGRDAAPRTIAKRCGAGVPAIDGQALYCAEAGTIARVDVASGTAGVVATAQPGARDLVIGGGRVFWRASPRPGQTLVMALPLDGIGGPTVFESGGPGPLLIATQGCDLYFTAGSSLVRRGL